MLGDSSQKGTVIIRTNVFVFFCRQPFVVLMEKSCLIHDPLITHNKSDHGSAYEIMHLAILPHLLVGEF